MSSTASFASSSSQFLCAPSARAAGYTREQLSQLPFCQNGLLDLEIIPAVGYRGFRMAADGQLS